MGNFHAAVGIVPWFTLRILLRCLARKIDEQTSLSISGIPAADMHFNNKKHASATVRLIGYQSPQT